MKAVLRRGLLFAVIAFTIVFLVDATLSLVFQPPPPREHLVGFLLAHGTFHAAVLLLSLLGAFAGYALIRNYLPSATQTAMLSVVYAIASLVVGPGAVVLAGPVGVAAWLFLGSMAFAVGTSVFRKPWRS
jgi:hypothetical protein